MERWQDKAAEYKKAGFSDDQIEEEKQSVYKEYTDAGIDKKAIDEYFGFKEFNKDPMKSLIEENYQKYIVNSQEPIKDFMDMLDKVIYRAEKTPESIGTGLNQTVAMQAYKAAHGESLLSPENMPREYEDDYLNVLQDISTVAGDLPIMIAGGVAAGAAAAPTGPVGMTIAAGAGSNALPASMRSLLMNYYEKGEIKDASDFFSRLGSVFYDTTKEATIGAATSFVGGKVSNKLLSKGISQSVTRIASTGSEVATMVAMSKGIEGEIPSYEDFWRAGAVVGGMAISGHVVKNMMRVYKDTGIHPNQQAEDAIQDPKLRADLISQTEEIPSAYQNRVEIVGEKIAATAEIAAVEKPTIEKPVTEEKIQKQELTPEQQILEKVKIPGEKQKTIYTKEDAYTDYTDKLYPIKNALDEVGKTDLSTSTDGYKLMRLFADYKSKVKHFFEKGTFNFSDLEDTGKSFDSIIEPHKNDIGGLKAFIIAKRASELIKKGIKTGFEKIDLESVIKNGQEKYGNTEKEIVNFQNQILKYYKDSGHISEDTYNLFVKLNENYIPFKRYFEEPKGKAVKRKSAEGLIKALQGSERDIIDPFLSIVDNSEALIKFAERNRGASAFVDQIISIEDQTVIKKVKTSIREFDISDKEAKDILEITGSEVTKENIDNVKDNFSIFRPQRKNLTEYQFEIFRNGKREVWETDNIRLAKALRATDFDQNQVNIIMKGMRAITTVHRLGISLTPDFILRNWFRDQMTSQTLTKTSGSFVDTLVAVGDIINKKDSYWQWLKSGGANGAFNDLNLEYSKKYEYISDPESAGKGFIKNVLKKPIQFLEISGSIVEMSTKLAEFKRTAEYKSGKKLTANELFSGGYASREATIDFQRIGAKVQAWNSIAAFSNAQIQGMDRIARAIKEDPVNFTKNAFIMYTVPSILLWYANKDDERIKEIPQWQKDIHWLIPIDYWKEIEDASEVDGIPDYLLKQENGKYFVNNGPVIRIPKGEIGMVFGSLIERTLESFVAENPDATFGLDETILNTFVPNYIPDAAKPIIEQSLNYNFFTNNNLVPFTLEGALPEDQYTEYTSDTAIQLGKLLSYIPMADKIGSEKAKITSPVVIDNYIRNWTGTIGVYATQILDKGLSAAKLAQIENKPDWTFADIPVIKAFIARYPNARSSSIEEFVSEYKDAKKYINSLNLRIERGNIEGALNIVDKNTEMLVALDDAYKSMNEFRKTINYIYYNKDMTSKEKRQFIDDQYYMMIEVAKHNLELTRQIKKNIKQSNEGNKQ